MVVFLGAVQAASLAVFRNEPAGEAMYRKLSAVAPSPYALRMLARATFERGDYADAESYATRMPPGSRRSQWLGRIALARGNRDLATRDFLQAGDIESVNAEIARRAASHDYSRAIALERALRDRLTREGAHPDGVADASWQLGVLLAARGEQAAALVEYRRAVAISPLNVKYLLAAGFEARKLHDATESEGYFARALDIDPGMAAAVHK